MNKNKDIIKSCLSGDYQAFAMLVDKYKSFVCSLTYCSTGNLNKSEDIARDAFINAWKSLPSLPDANKFHSWLAGITRDTLNNHRSTETQSAAKAITEPENLLNYTPVPTDPTDAVIVQEENMILWRTLQSLPVAYRETLVLYYRHEKSTKQVAELLSISEQAVRDNLSGGREMLRERVEHRLEAGIRNSAPDKNFTAMVIAAVSSIPMTIAAGKTASAGKEAFSATPAKIAAAVIIAAIVIIGIAAMNMNNKTTPLTNAPQPQAVIPQPAPQTQQQPLPKTQQPAKPQPIAAAKTAVKQQPAPAVETPAVIDDSQYIFTPKGILSGIVTDKETNEPIASLPIGLSLPDGQALIATTDENGSYCFETIPSAGSCSIGIESKDYVKPKKITLNLTSQSQEMQDIELEKACVLEVLVTEKNGTPIEGATVVLTEAPVTSVVSTTPINGFKDKTDTNGVVTIGGIKASEKPYLLTVWYIMEQAQQAAQTAAYQPAHSIIHLSDRNVIANCVMVLSKSCLIEGYVYDNQGNPHAGIKLTATPVPTDNIKEESIEPQPVTTDSLGYYRFDNLSERLWRIGYTSPLPGVCLQTVMASEDIPTLLNFGGVNLVSGRILLNSVPVANCRVAIADAPDYNAAGFLNNDFTSEDGGFIFSGILPGKKFLMYKPHDNWVILAEFDANNNDLNVGDINMAPDNPQPPQTDPPPQQPLQ